MVGLEVVQCMRQNDGRDSKEVSFGCDDKK